MRKEIIIPIVAVIFAPIIISIVVYILFGFLSWLRSDPFHFIKTTSHINPYISDIERCRNIGGFPHTSVWDGRLLECSKFEAK